MTTWNEATPAGTDYISGGDNIIREHKIATRERLAREHYMAGSGDDANDGRHRFQCGLDAAKPTAIAGHIYVATDTLYVYISPANGVWIPLRADDPVGIIKMWGGNITIPVPTGWLLCDGNWVSRTTYAALFAVIGTVYGIGDGVSYFTLPNFKGRVPVGFDTSQEEFNTFGEMGGEKTHTLAESEMPSHTHTAYVGDPGHNHLFDPNNPVVMHTAPTGTHTLGGGSALYLGGNIQPALTGISVANEWKGGSVAHNNLPPYLTVNYIIKY